MWQDQISWVFLQGSVSVAALRSWGGASAVVSKGLCPRNEKALHEAHGAGCEVTSPKFLKVFAFFAP